jgi:enediyne biosynthesis protein E4
MSGRILPAEAGSHTIDIFTGLVCVAVLLVVPPVRVAGPPFVESAAASGLTFTHDTGASWQYYMAEQMGAGAALFDYDNDGDLDVFLVQGGALGPSAKASGPSRLFRNDLTVGPDGTRTLRFTDVTDRAGVGWRGYGMGVAVADYDNDGDQDLFLTSFGPEALFRNNGDGTFTDVTVAAGVSDPLWSTSASFFDYDRDGDLDLFVANYLDFTLAGNKVCYDPLGARDYCGPRAYRSVPDRLYRNEGNGRFTDVTEAAGIARADGAGLGVVAGDYNLDGWLDLFVANDATPNQMWINQRNGRFVDEGVLSGTAFNAAGNPEGSMGIASGDADADGDEDLFVTNIIGETFALYENDGHATFEDARARWGVAQPTAAFTGFGTDWIDYDNDGWLDLFITNGAVNLIESQRGQPLPFRMKNLLFRNDGSRHLTNVSAGAGPAFAMDQTGRGAAFGDVDNDGDTDIVATNNGGPVRLLINQAAGSAHWLQVRLEQPGNRQGIGALVGVERAGKPTLWRRVKTDGSYASASDSRIQAGLGESAAVTAVVVHWPDGGQERWTGIQADRLVTFRRGTGQMLPATGGAK